MTKLLQKDVKFVWSPACEEAFQALKKFLTSAPVLTQPDIDRPFDVYCDASRTGLGITIHIKHPINIWLGKNRSRGKKFL